MTDYWPGYAGGDYTGGAEMKMVGAEEQERIMREQEEVRAEAEAHGRGYRDIPILEIPGGGMISKRVYEPVRPLPAVRDEHGEILEQNSRQLFLKIYEELHELTEVYFMGGNAKEIAEEAADLKTAITTFEEWQGIDAEMRDEAQRRVNEKNRSRGRL